MADSATSPLLTALPSLDSTYGSFLIGLFFGLMSVPSLGLHWDLLTPCLLDFMACRYIRAMCTCVPTSATLYTSKYMCVYWFA